MFLINDKKKKSKGGFAEGVQALSDLLSVGTKLATMSATCLFIYIIRDGLAEAFTRDFVRLSMVGGALLAVGGAYTLYKIADRMAEAAEEAAIAVAEKAKAEKEAERLRSKEAEQRNDQRAFEMQAQFQALLIAAMSGQPKSSAKTGAPSALRGHQAKLEIARNNKKPNKKDAFVVK